MTKIHDPLRVGQPIPRLLQSPRLCCPTRKGSNIYVNYCLPQSFGLRPPTQGGYNKSDLSEVLHGKALDIATLDHHTDPLNKGIFALGIVVGLEGGAEGTRHSIPKSGGEAT